MVDFKLPLINGENLSPCGYGDSQQARHTACAVATTERGRPVMGKQQSGLHGNMKSGAEMTPPEGLKVMLNVLEGFYFHAKLFFVSHDSTVGGSLWSSLKLIGDKVLLKLNCYIGLFRFKYKPWAYSFNEGKCLPRHNRPLVCFSPLFGAFSFGSEGASKVFMNYLNHLGIAYRYDNAKLIVRHGLAIANFVFNNSYTALSVDKPCDISEHFFVKHRHDHTIDTGYCQAL